MKPIASVAWGVLLVTAAMSPAFAQPLPPLSYVQPVPPSAIQAVQDHLRGAGSYSGSADGVWGPDSLAALQRFQATHQLQVTGQLNQATAVALGLDPNALLGIPPSAPPLPPPDRLRPASVRAIQSSLRNLGFYNGNVDGIWGDSTQSAIERFQQGRGLQPNGQLNAATVGAMGLTQDSVSYR